MLRFPRKLILRVDSFQFSIVDSDDFASQRRQRRQRIHILSKNFMSRTKAKRAAKSQTCLLHCVVGPHKHTHAASSDLANVSALIQKVWENPSKTNRKEFAGSLQSLLGLHMQCRVIRQTFRHRSKKCVKIDIVRDRKFLTKTGIAVWPMGAQYNVYALTRRLP